MLRYIGRFSEGIEDTVALNWVLGAMKGRGEDGEGFIRRRRGREVTQLRNYLAEYTFWGSSEGGRPPTTTTTTTTTTTNDNNPPLPSRWHHNYLVFKTGVLLSTLFLFFLTTTLVSFTLRETQDRMFIFTLELTSSIRRSRPYGSLIVAHVVENMVFVPIMIGTIFFLMDCFYGDNQFLAFVVLSGVWVCEVFLVVR